MNPIRCPKCGSERLDERVDYFGGNIMFVDCGSMIRTDGLFCQDDSCRVRERGRTIADLTASLANLNDTNAALVAENDRLKREYASRSDTLEAATQGIAHRDEAIAKIKAERDDLRRKLAHWFGCPSCGERHPDNVMCPPHEVRTTGQAWFHVRLAEAKEREDRLTAERDGLRQQVARLVEAGSDIRGEAIRHERLMLPAFATVAQTKIDAWDEAVKSATCGDGSRQTPDAPTPP